MRKTLIATLFLLALVGAAAVVDRVAVVVGKTVITESEVLQELRLAEFLNGQTLDLGPEQRRAAAERLVDQQLIRNEMEIGHYPEPTPTETEAVLRKFRQEHYVSINLFRAALEKYGITEDQLKQHLIWQLEAIHFTDLRFRMGAAAPPVATPNRTRGGVGTTNGGTSQSANRAAPESVQAGTAPEATVDQQMDVWLKEARSQTRIQFKKEAFQ
jgi:hypothetical protein